MTDDSKALEIFREEKGAKARKAVNLKRPQIAVFFFLSVYEKSISYRS